MDPLSPQDPQTPAAIKDTGLLAMNADAHPSEAGGNSKSRHWARQLASIVQHSLIGLGFVAMLGGSAALVGGWTTVPILPAIPPLFLAWFLVILIHEAGHLAGARAGGMIPCSIGLPGLLAWRTSSGWRLRPSWGMKGAAGYVTVHYRAGRPFKRQAMLLIAAGPATNLLVGGLLCSLSSMLPPALFAYTLALGVLNVMVGVANLLPSGTQFLDNDGLLLLRWLRGEFEAGPERAIMEVNALSCSGVQAKDLPEHLLRDVGEYPAVGVLLQMWFRLASLESTEQWAAAAKLGDPFEACIHSLSAHKSPSLGIFAAQMRAEIAFAAVMEKTSSAPSEAPSIPDELDWYFPALRPRCEALKAAMDGDAGKAARLLLDSAHKMRRSVDLAHVRSEMHLRQCIERLIARHPIPARDTAGEPGPA
jgi:hypothetical protein